MKIDFNRPAIVGKELEYIKDAVDQGMLCGDGKYTKLCSDWMKERFQVNQVFLTTSCTHALEMAAFLCDIHPGDEVIMPSYTFVSTADAVADKAAEMVESSAGAMAGAAQAVTSRNPTPHHSA